MPARPGAPVEAHAPTRGRVGVLAGWPLPPWGERAAHTRSAAGPTNRRSVIPRQGGPTKGTDKRRAAPDLPPEGLASGLGGLSSASARKLIGRRPSQDKKKVTA